jgi:hypothetical protein
MALITPSKERVETVASLRMAEASSKVRRAGRRSTPADARPSKHFACRGGSAIAEGKNRVLAAVTREARFTVPL